MGAPVPLYNRFEDVHPFVEVPKADLMKHETRVLRPRDPTPEVRGAPGPVTSKDRSCAYMKGALQRLSFVVVFAPVPLGRFRGGRAVRRGWARDPWTLSGGD